MITKLEDVRKKISNIKLNLVESRIVELYEEVNKVGFNESINNKHSELDDINIIVNTMPNIEKDFTAPRAKYDSSIIRTLEYDNDIPIAYCEIWSPKDKSIGYVNIGVNNNYRGKGLSKKVFRKALYEAKNKGIKLLYWNASISNHISQKLAISLGFLKSKEQKSEDEISFYMV